MLYIRRYMFRLFNSKLFNFSPIIKAINPRKKTQSSIVKSIFSLTGGIYLIDLEKEKFKFYESWKKSSIDNAKVAIDLLELAIEQVDSINNKYESSLKELMFLLKQIIDNNAYTEQINDNIIITRAKIKEFRQQLEDLEKFALCALNIGNMVTDLMQKIDSNSPEDISLYKKLNSLLIHSQTIFKEIHSYNKELENNVLLLERDCILLGKML